MFRELIQYRNLLWMLTLRDIKIRYKQTVMGFLWAIFMPLLIVFAGLLVKKGFSIVSGKPMDLARAFLRLHQSPSVFLFHRFHPLRHEQPDRKREPRHQDLLSRGRCSRSPPSSRTCSTSSLGPSVLVVVLAVDRISCGLSGDMGAISDVFADHSSRPRSGCCCPARIFSSGT